MVWLDWFNSILVIHAVEAIIFVDTEQLLPYEHRIQLIHTTRKTIGNNGKAYKNVHIVANAKDVSAGGVSESNKKMKSSRKKMAHVNRSQRLVQAAFSTGYNDFTFEYSFSLEFSCIFCAFSLSFSSRIRLALC